MLRHPFWWRLIGFAPPDKGGYQARAPAAYPVNPRAPWLRMSWFADFQARTALQTVNAVNSVTADAAQDEAAEHAARQAEPTITGAGHARSGWHLTGGRLTWCADCLRPPAGRPSRKVCRFALRRRGVAPHDGRRPPRRATCTGGAPPGAPPEWSHPG